MPTPKRKQQESVDNNASIRKIAEQEFIRCAVDPVHFFKKYAKIQHPQRGKINFELYPFQEDTLRAFKDNRFNIILKSRQMGISTLVAGYALHSMMFNDDFKVLVIATKQEVAKNLVQKVQLMFEFLPDFLKQGITIVNNNKLGLLMSNGSSIKAVASSPDAARSESLSLLVIDECLDYDAEVTLKNKETGEIFSCKIGDLYEKPVNCLVLTPNGWSNFGGVKKTSSEVLFTIQFTDGTVFKCTDNHQLKYPTGEFLEASQVKVGDELFGGKIVSNKDYEIGEFDVYDLIDVELENEYYTSGVVSHNCAFIPDMDEIWTSAQMTLATGGNAIVLSTPNGINLFHQIWQNAENGDSEDGLDKFNPIKLPWYLHPERDGNWRKQQDVILGKRNAAQECFTGETLIYTDKGLRRIDSIKVGDMVLTHTGEFKPVVKLFSKTSDDIFLIETIINNHPVYVTGNHPIYVKDIGWKDVKDITHSDYLAAFPVNKIPSKNTTHIIDLFEEVVPAFFTKKLVSDDLFYINDRKHKRVHNRYLEIDYDIGYVVGLYLAEGSGCRLRKTFSFNYETELNTWVSKVVDKIRIKFGINTTSTRTTRTEKSGQLDICSEVFCWVIDKLVDGNNCYNKKLSDYSWGISNIHYLSGVLDGYMQGDGMILPKYDVQSSTKSPYLCNDIKYIASICGFPYMRRQYISATHDIRHDFDKPHIDAHDTHKIFLKNTKGNTKDNVSEITQPLFVKDRMKRYFIDDKFVYTKVNKIEKTDRIETVYNLEVEEHHTYVTDHFVVHNCDAEFLSSGHTVVDADDIAFYTANTVQEPIEKRGIGGDIWIWRYPDYSKSYAAAVDPARGDGEDYSTILIFEVESMEQVVEFKGKVDPQTLGHMAVSLSTEYNNALLIIDNKNVGFGTVQVALDKNYPNLYRTYRHDPYLDEAVHLTKGYDLKSEQDTVPGFTISTKIRPVLISKLENYLREREVIVRSKRLVNEMYVFVWLNGKAQAQRGYNDDLIMALAMFFYVRDTALRLRQLGIELIRSSLRSIHKPVYKSKPLGAEKWEMTINGKQESIKWLINR